jgi:hypothetical protein
VTDDGRSDWLDMLKAQAQGIRSSLIASVLLVFIVIITLLGQFRKLTTDQQEEQTTACFSPDLNHRSDERQNIQSNRNVACPVASDWDTLQAAYEELPVQAIDEELIPWNKFAMETTLVASLTEGADRKEIERSTDASAPFIIMLLDASNDAPLKTGTATGISHFYIHLKEFNANFKSIEWASNAKVPFEDLSRDKLIALSNAYDFDIDSGDVLGQNLAKSVANPTFLTRLGELRLARLNPKTAKPIVEDGFISTLTAGTSLDSFKTLRGQLMVNDLAKFQTSPDQAESKRLLTFLTTTPFASIATARNEDARLKKQIQAIRDGKTDSSITIPLLNFPVTLSDFSSLSGILNVFLLVWVFWQSRQMDIALNRYRSFAPYDKSRIEAALSGLPSRSWWLPGFTFAFCLAAPTLVGTGLLFMPIWTDRSQSGRPSYMYLVFVGLVFTLAFAVVHAVQSTKSKALTTDSGATVEPSAMNIQHP